MKKYIYLALAITLTVIGFNFGWYFEGESAIAAANQVLTGFDYQAARAEYRFWQTVHTAVNVGAVIFFGLFVVQILKTKKK
jgi:hypothetical protein